MHRIARLILPATVALALGAALATSAGCSSQPKSRHFTDTFDGTVFPDRGWSVGGTAPVIVSTAGDPAPSLTWPACGGSNGAFAAIDGEFDANYSLDGRMTFAVTGSAASANTGILYHFYGSNGDDAAFAILPPPTSTITIELDGGVASFPLPTDGQFHAVELYIDGYGEAGWLFDGNLLGATGPFYSSAYLAEILCGEGDGQPGPVPVLIDNVDISARVNP